MKKGTDRSCTRRVIVFLFDMICVLHRCDSGRFSKMQTVTSSWCTTCSWVVAYQRSCVHCWFCLMWMEIALPVPVCLPHCWISRVLVHGTILLSCAVDARSYFLETVQVWFSVAVQVFRPISRQRRYLLPHRRRSKCSSEVDVDLDRVDTFVSSQCASGSARDWAVCGILFERVMGFCDRFVFSRHGRVFVRAWFFLSHCVALSNCSSFWAQLKRRKRRERERGEGGRDREREGER